MFSLCGLCCAGLVLEASSLNLFVELGKRGGSPIAKNVLMAVFLIGVSSILISGVYKLCTRKVIILCTTLSLGAAVVMQVFGFLLYPGLSKDVLFLSRDHLALTLTQWLGAMFAFGAITVAALFMKRALLRFKELNRATD